MGRRWLAPPSTPVDYPPTSSLARMASLKRRHEDSSYASQLSEYSLRKEPQPTTRNVCSLSTDMQTNNYTAEEDRVHSPNSVMETHGMFNPPRESKRTLSFASKRNREGEASHSEDGDPDAEKRVTIWNWREQRKLSGNSAPFKKNLRDYMRKHPDWEQYVGQDKDTITGKKLSPKKMKIPAPSDPEHPWFTHGSVPQTCPSTAREVAPHTSSYGTRSTRLQESENRTQESKPSREQIPERVPANPELFQPFSIKLEDPAELINRRAVEVAARRQSIVAEASGEDSSAPPKADGEDSSAPPPRPTARIAVPPPPRPKIPWRPRLVARRRSLPQRSLLPPRRSLPRRPRRRLLSRRLPRRHSLRGEPLTRRCRAAWSTLRWPASKPGGRSGAQPLRAIPNKTQPDCRNRLSRPYLSFSAATPTNIQKRIIVLENWGQRQQTTKKAKKQTQVRPPAQPISP